MSTYYSCNIYLRASYSNDSLLTIFRKGKKLGLIYFNLQDYSGDLDPSTNMSAEEALNHIVTGRTIKKDAVNFPKGLTLQYDDTIFTLNFYNDGHNIILYFFVLQNPWEKQCGSYAYTDFGRYIKLWIDMCEDFCIYHIETRID